MKGLFRCSYHLSRILELSPKSQHQVAQAYMVQLSRGLHQTQIDNGSWDNSVYLLPVQDLVSKVLFGGTERELETIFKYRESLRKLMKGQGSDNIGTDARGDSKGWKKKDKKEGDGEAGQ